MTKFILILGRNSKLTYKPSLVFTRGRLKV